MGRRGRSGRQEGQGGGQDSGRQEGQSGGSWHLPNPEPQTPVLAWGGGPITEVRSDCDFWGTKGAVARRTWVPSERWGPSVPLHALRGSLPSLEERLAFLGSRPTSCWFIPHHPPNSQGNSAGLIYSHTCLLRLWGWGLSLHPACPLMASWTQTPRPGPTCIALPTVTASHHKDTASRPLPRTQPSGNLLWGSCSCTLSRVKSLPFDHLSHCLVTHPAHHAGEAIRPYPLNKQTTPVPQCPLTTA